MIKEITREWLEKKYVCHEGIEWFEAQQDTNPFIIIKKLKKEEKYRWALWLIAHCMITEQRKKYVIYMADLILPLYERIYHLNRPFCNILQERVTRARNRLINGNLSEASAAAYAAIFAYAAYAETSAADSDTYKQIINHGIKLLEEKL